MKPRIRHDRRSWLAGLAAAAAALAVVGAARAAPGDLDLSFGTDGVVGTDIGPFDSASDLAIESDGRIVAVGTVDESGARNVFVARYLVDGSLDGTFGAGGIVVPDRHHQIAPQLALQPDGKIVLATRGESAGGPVFLYRFAANGVPDEAFGDGGTAVVSPPAGLSIAGVAGVAISGSGKIVVALRATPAVGGSSVAFARFTAAGTPDPTFGSGGFVDVQRGGVWLPLAFALQPGGEMVVGGFASLPGRFFSDAFVARFHADGTPDGSFASDGLTLVQRPSNGTEFQALAITADGSILAGGREWGSVFGQNRWLLAKFTDEGALAGDFGTAGLALYDPGSGDDVILDLVATPAGIYATGLTESLLLGLPLALFAPDGSLDAAFGTGGLTGLAGEFTRGAWRLAVQPDARVVVYGSLQSFTPTFNQDLYLARYEGSFLDAVAPVLALPSGVAADAISPDGAVVDYSDLVSADDAVDGPVPVTCSPAPGTLFSIGDTTVTCTATDAAGNTSSGSFTVHVKDAAEQLGELAAAVRAAGLGKGATTSLLSPLAGASRALLGGRAKAACVELAAFVKYVGAQRGKAVSAALADAWLADAARIGAAAGCTPTISR